MQRVASGLSIEMYIILPCPDSNIPETLKVTICNNDKYDFPTDTLALSCSFTDSFDKYI